MFSLCLEQINEEDPGSVQVCKGFGGEGCVSFIFIVLALGLSWMRNTSFV